jgi:hypothetical protein
LHVVCGVACCVFLLHGYSFENANVAHPYGLASPLSSFLKTSKSCK